MQLIGTVVAFIITEINYLAVGKFHDFSSLAALNIVLALRYKGLCIL